MVRICVCVTLLCRTRHYNILEMILLIIAALRGRGAKRHLGYLAAYKKSQQDCGGGLNQTSGKEEKQRGTSLVGFREMVGTNGEQQWRRGKPEVGIWPYETQDACKTTTKGQQLRVHVVL